MIGSDGVFWPAAPPTAVLVRDRAAFRVAPACSSQLALHTALHETAQQQLATTWDLQEEREVAPDVAARRARAAAATAPRAPPRRQPETPRR